MGKQCDGAPYCAITCNDCHPRDKYKELRRVLADAAEQAASGKGKERHANDDPFEDQQIVQIGEWLGSTGFNIGQAVKKAIESGRLPRERAIAELRGAINYLAGAILIHERAATREGAQLELPLVARARKFGERVRVFGTGVHTDAEGKTGTVIDTSGLLTLVRLDEALTGIPGVARIWCERVESLSPDAARTTPLGTPSIVVGARVRITASHRVDDTGKTGTLQRHDMADSGLPYMVKLDMPGEDGLVYTWCCGIESVEGEGGVP